MEALKDYPVEEARRALFNFRGQRDRTFAPTLSEFEGVLRDFAEEAAQNRNVRLSFQNRGAGEPTETYEKNGRTYIRVSRSRRREIHNEAIAAGKHLEIIPLSGRTGEVGYSYLKK